jgi:hypothetical protein
MDKTMDAPPILIIRTVFLKTPAGSTVAALVGTAGVSDVQPRGRRLRVRYDLRCLRYDDIQRLASAAGLSPANGILCRLYRYWARFNEANLLDQANLVHHCCGTPPGESSPPSGRTD